MEPDTGGTTAFIPQLVDQLFTLEATIRTESAAMLAELDLTEPLADLLWRLDPDGPPMSMRQLAEVLVCDPTNVTFLADRLEKRGLLERQRHPVDRRVTILTLTPAGVELRSRLLTETGRRLPFLHLTVSEQQQLLLLLSKVNHREATHTHAS